MPLLVALATLSACSDPTPSYSASAAVDDTITTLVHVTWEPADADVSVEYEAPTGDHVATGAGSATLYGLRADTDVRWRLARGDWRGDWQTTRTGALPTGIPTFEVLEGTLDADYVLLSWQEFPAESTGVYIIDHDGAIVWYWLPDWGIVPVAHPSGGDLLVMHSAHDTIEDATVERVPLDGAPPSIAPLPLAHHDVIEVPGGYAAIVGEVREIDGEAVVGDTLTEVLDDGTTRVVWNAFDEFPVTRHEAWGAGTYTAGVDWTHANGLFYDAAEDAYYLSLFYLRSVVKIDRATGATRWVLGGENATLALPNDAGPGRQHAPELVDGELMVFDNGYNDPAGSRLVRYAVDEAAGTATRTWEWRHPDALFTFVFGDIDVLPGGGHLSTWGNYGEVVATDAAGAITWRARITPGYLLAQAEVFTF